LTPAAKRAPTPEQILVWHEIVNDNLGGVPITVSYCPLCNSALVFDRRVGHRTLTFGTTGKLRNSDLVMWDRETQSWWQQFTGTGLVGRYAATALRPFDSQVLSWSQFRASYPQGTVLSRDTALPTPLRVKPVPKLRRRARLTAAVLQRASRSRLPALERVVAVFAGDQVVVVPFSTLVGRPVIVGSIAGAPLVVLYAPGVVSALDAGTIAHSRDVGTAGAFDPVAGRRTLRFSPAGQGLFRDQAGTTWNIAGRAVAGPLRGRQLRPLRHDEQFWFALAAFVPRARLLTAAAGS